MLELEKKLLIKRVNYVYYWLVNNEEKQVIRLAIRSVSQK
jgi:hypothetical protein